MLTLSRTVNPSTAHMHTVSTFIAIGSYFYNIIYTHCVVLVAWVNNEYEDKYEYAHALTHTVWCAHQHLYLLSYPETNTYTALPLLCLHLREFGVKVLRPVHSLRRVAVSCCLPVMERCGAWTNTLSVLLLSLIADQLGPNPLCAIRWLSIYFMVYLFISPQKTYIFGGGWGWIWVMIELFSLSHTLYPPIMCI